MQLPHDRERLEHLRGTARRPPPVLSAEGDLSYLLPGAKAVIGAAAGKALLPEAVVNGAAEIRLQIRAGLPGVLVDGEVSRGGEGRRDAAQRETALAVSTQAQPKSPGDGRVLEFVGQRGW